MTYDEYILNSRELYHYGILGMKWGVRRYQNKDGSLTPAGRDRYSDEISSAKKKIRDMKSLDSLIDEGTKRRRVQFAKRDLSDLKIKQKLSSEKTKSNSRLEAEKKLIEKEGYSPEQAAIEAYRRERLKKIALAAAGVTVTAAAAYVAYKHWDNVTDKVIDPGTLLSRVTTDNTKELGDRFYATLSRTKDSFKYSGNYAMIMTMQKLQPYQKIIRAVDTINIASRKKASEAFRDLIASDSDYRRDVLDSFERFREQLESQSNASAVSSAIGTLRRASRMIENGRYDDRVYDALNIYMDDFSSSVNKRFYSEMAKRGYDAVVDMMDKRYSGYNTKMPLVIFNKSKAIVEDVKKLEIGDVMENIKKMSTPIDSAAAISKITIVPSVAIRLAFKLNQNVSNNHNDRKIINSYKKDHPNSKLSDREIVRNYYGYK